MFEELTKLIDMYDVISFDIFDTLLFRNVYHPTDIFKIMERELKEKYDIDNFYDIRVSSEAKARVGKPNGECNFDEIYDEIDKILDGKQTEYAKKLEIKLENEFLCANPFMKKIYDYCKEKDKTVIYISDMYLPSEIIGKILYKNGYGKDKLYVSCEYHKNKCGKELYTLVEKENGIDKSKWLHIGDNVNSDYNIPKELGLHSYRYKNTREYDTSYIPNSIEESIITAIQFNKLYNGLELPYWEKFGILNVSPLYFSYSLWLYCLTKDKDNLFFLARDGYIIKKIYELFPKTDTYLKYIYCSRKSLQVPSLYDCSDDYLTFVLTLKHDICSEKTSLSRMFESAQLDCTNPKYKQLIKSFGFKSFDEIIDEDNYEPAKKLIATQVDDIREGLKYQRDLAIEYLNQEGMDKFKKINVVDVGWGGSIQYAIKKLLKKDINGYYFGTIISEKEEIYSSMFGYYFDLDYKPEDKEEIMNNVMIYELLFSAPHGPTLGYQKGKTVKPILGEDENSDTVEAFQEAALDTIKEYLKYYDYFDYIDKYFATYRIRTFIKEKKYEDVNKFHRLSVDIILSSNKKYPYVQEFTKKYINTHYAKFLENKADSLWKDSFIISDGDEKDYYALLKKVNKDERRVINNKVKDIRRRIIPFGVRKRLQKIANKKNAIK